MTVPSVTAPGSTPTPTPAPSTDKTKKTGEETNISDAKKTQTAKEQIGKQLKEKALPELNKQLTEVAKKSLDPVKKEAVAIVKTIVILIKDIKTYLGLKFPCAAKALSDFETKHPILMGIFKGAAAVTAIAIPIVASVFASIAIDSFPLTTAVSLGITMFLMPHARGALEKLDAKIENKIGTLKLQKIINTPGKDLCGKDIDDLLSLRKKLPKGAHMPKEMQDVLSKVTSTLCERIQVNSELSMGDINLLARVYDSLDKNSPEAANIEQTVSNNFQAVALGSGDEHQLKLRDSLIADVAVQYAEGCSADVIFNIATVYQETSARKASAIQAKHLGNLNCALLGINNKLAHDFGNVTPDDTKKLQVILNTLSPEAIILTSHDKMSTQLQALQVLQNKASGVSDLNSVLERLNEQKEENSPLGKALREQIDVLTKKTETKDAEKPTPTSE